MGWRNISFYDNLTCLFPLKNNTKKQAYTLTLPPQNKNGSQNSDHHPTHDATQGQYHHCWQKMIQARKQ